jgi:hypothetical protein
LSRTFHSKRTVTRYSCVKYAFDRQGFAWIIWISDAHWDFCCSRIHIIWQFILPSSISLFRAKLCECEGQHQRRRSWS